jgi:hypothetical protein
MDLILSVPGASPEEIARGIAAAESALERAGFTAEEAADGVFALEGWNINAFPEDGLDDRAGDAARAASATDKRRTNQARRRHDCRTARPRQGARPFM